jgi:hypothetical protein
MTDRRKILRAWLYAMRILERRLRIEQGRTRNAMIRKAAKEYETNGHPPLHLFITHRARTQDNLATHYHRTIPVFSRLALKHIKSRRIERKSTIQESLMLDWVSKQSLRKAQLIADTDRDDVLAAISKGLAEGEGVATIAKQIRDVTGLTAFRAATVARTETHAAATFGSIESVREAERQLGVTMVKSWLPTLDQRTRPEHAAMAASDPIPMDDKFIVGGEPMDRPGDTSASPENLINCRCAIAFEEA